MRVKALLRDTRDGYEKWFADTWDYEDEWQAEYMWTDGNFNCDCNRSVFMYGPDGKLPCGNVIDLVRLEVDQC